MTDLGIIEFSPVAQFAIGFDHRIMRWNRACELMTGLDAEEMIGTDRHWEPFYPTKRPLLADLVVDHDRKGIVRVFGDQKVARSKVIPQAWETERYFEDVGGQPRHLRFLAAPIYHPDGTIIGAVESFLDMTEQRNFEQALIQSEEAYRVLAENVPDGVALMQKGKYLKVNVAFARMFGYESPDRLIGMDAHEPIAESHKEEYRKAIAAIEAGLSHEKVLAWPCVTRDGREIWVEGHPNVILWDKMPAVLSTIMDITEKRSSDLAIQAERKQLLRENVRLKSSIKYRYRLGGIIGKSPVMQEVYELIMKAASADAGIIIYGESGTGKELVARAIHEMSDRHESAFVPVNCGAIPENLLESEFFGHKKGAFTGAYADKSGTLNVADGGTLFLDEVGELDLNMQVKLLRALDSGSYTPVGGTKPRKADLRIVAATNRNLIEEVGKGSMREDFFYRIHVIPIHLPPLRKRKEDIPLLVDDFLQTFDRSRRLSGLPGKVMDALYSYDWPGNVRELQNALQGI